MNPIRIAIIGAGAHAAGQHLPALLDHERRHPGSVTVAAVCDRDTARAAALAAPWGAAVHDDWRACLDQVRPDAVHVCLPPALTPRVALAAATAGAAVWVEKPLAATLAEAEELVAGLATARAMASMNRRFEPAMARLCALTAGRRPRRLHAVMARGDRREADFITTTGVHVVDLAVSLVGGPDGPPVLRTTSCDGAAWAQITWTTPEGCTATVEICPTLGINQEAVEIAGDGWWCLARSAWFDAGLVEWQEKSQPLRRETIDLTLPEWVRNGTAAETDAFLASCRGERPWSPIPAEILVATRLCHTKPVA